MIALQDLTLAYERRPAVHHISGRFDAGSLTAVVGPNGAGKSTLLRALVGAVRPSSGTLDLGGLKRRDIAYLPQQASIDRSFPISVLDTVVMGDWAQCGILAAIRGAARRRAREALSRRSGCEGFDDRVIGTMSAGQFQRLLFARLLVQDADLILLDEPFNAVDARTAADLLACCGAGTARAAPSSPCCTTSTWCATPSPTACCWRARRSPSARPPRC
jgi:zinc/manganese transport system ATP-binding protein